MYLRYTHKNAATILSNIKVEHLIFNSHCLWLWQAIQSICRQYAASDYTGFLPTDKSKHPLPHHRLFAVT